MAPLFVSFCSSLLRSHSRSTGAYFPFSLSVFSTSSSLSFVRFPSASSYSAFCSSFPSLLGSALQLLPRCPSPLSLPRFPLSLQPDFSCLPSRFLYSASLMVSFHPSLIHSRSCSSGAYLVLSLSVFPLSFHILSSASVPVLTTQPLFLPFLFFPALPHSGFSGATSLPFGFLAFPLPFHPVSCVSLLFLSTQLSAFPFSVHCLASQWLPQCLSLLPFDFWPFPLGFRFRFWLLSFRIVSFANTSFRLRICCFRSRLPHTTT